MPGPSGSRPPESWEEAVRNGPWGPPPPFRAPSGDLVEALRAVYARADEALAAITVCQGCGRCCRFERLSPVLFASALELACLVAAGGMPCPEKAVPPGQPDAPWHCPYQEGDRCGAREARPLGCRTYFCDAEAREAGEGAYAEALREIQRIAAGQEPWWYGPARLYLEHVQARPQTAV